MSITLIPHSAIVERNRERLQNGASAKEANKIDSWRLSACSPLARSLSVACLSAWHRATPSLLYIQLLGAAHDKRYCIFISTSRSEFSRIRGFLTTRHEHTLTFLITYSFIHVHGHIHRNSHTRACACVEKKRREGNRRKEPMKKKKKKKKKKVRYVSIRGDIKYTRLHSGGVHARNLTAAV